MTHRAGRCEAAKRRRSGFSLIEVLLAIFILAIGIISIAALFPAGIAQQRMSTDDAMGSVVANHAMSVIRSKVRPRDFGTFEEFAFLADVPYVNPTVPGDWGWLRPSFYLQNDTSTDFQEPGAIDIFSNRHVELVAGTSSFPNIRRSTEFFDGWAPPGGTTPLFGVPFNTNVYPLESPPRIIFSQEERYYPMASQLAAGGEPPRPQYVWDCMFRRFQGRIYVAIFVYRVNMPPGGVAYRVPRHPDDDRIPALPIRRDIGDETTGPWNVQYENGIPSPFIQTGQPFADFDPFAHDQAWQHPRQWLLDQNNNIHRVLSRGRHPDVPDRSRIELARPLTPITLPWFAQDTTSEDSAGSPYWYFGDPANSTLDFPYMDQGVVTDLWYMPAEINVDTTGDGNPDDFVRLTPVYVTVKEL